MKKLVVALLVVGMMIGPAFAHPGGTDYKGGHTDRSTGEYHYHHGYSAHDHVDGVCPYDYDDRTGENSGSSGSRSSYTYTPVAVAEDWYDEYCDAQEARRAAEKELEEIKSNQLRNLALSAVVGLCGGLSTLIVQIRRSHKRLEEQERRLLDRAEREIALADMRVLETWKKQMKDNPPEQLVAVGTANGGAAWYHRVNSPCTDTRGPAFKQVVVFDAIEAGKDPCPFCKPMSIRGAEQWRLQRERRIESDRRMAKLIENQEAERERIEEEVRREQERRTYRMQSEIIVRCESVLEAMKEGANPDLSDGIVYISRDGIDAYYHHWNECSKVNTPILVSKRRAEIIGFTPCTCCGYFKAPEHDVLVDVSTGSGGKCYHAHNSWCLTFAETVSLDKAIADGYKPCERCHPPVGKEKIWF